MPAELPRRGVLRSDLRNAYFDGLFWGVMVGLAEMSLQTFALAAGASEVATGLVATVPLLVGALLQLSVSWGVARIRSHRRWVIGSVVLQAASLLFLAVLALIGQVATAVLFVVVTLYWGAGLAGGPAWVTWMGTLVPARIRARYFAHRAVGSQVTIFLGLLAGAAILQFAGPRLRRPLDAFALMFLAAGAGRFLCVRFLSAQSEPVPMPEGTRSLPLVQILRRLGRTPDGRFLLYMFLTQFTVQIAAPFFTPYLQKQLGCSYARILLLTAVMFAARICAMPLAGRLAHRFGAGKLLWLGGVGIVPLTVLWIPFSSFGWLLLLHALTGAVWAAHELATSLLFFEQLPEEERTSLVSFLLLGNTVFMVAGSLVGGWLLDVIGGGRQTYFILFALSFGARALTLPLLRQVTGVRFERIPAAIRRDAGFLPRMF